MSVEATANSKAPVSLLDPGLRLDTRAPCGELRMELALSEARFATTPRTLEVAT